MRYRTREELKDIPFNPDETDSWKPVALHTMVEAIHTSIRKIDRRASSEEYALYGDEEDVLFGMIHTGRPSSIPDCSYSMLFRCGTNKIMGFQICAALRIGAGPGVFMYPQPIVFQRRFGRAFNLEREMESVFDLITVHEKRAELLVEGLKGYTLTAESAYKLVFFVLEQKILPVTHMRRLASVIKPRTKNERYTRWDLYQAVATQMYILKPWARYTALLKLGTMFSHWEGY